MTRLPPFARSGKGLRPLQACLLALAVCHSGRAECPHEPAGCGFIIPSAAPAPPAPDQLGGSWPIRTSLVHRGISPFAIWTTETWGNVAGGLEQGAWWNALLDFGFELDTANLGWWKNGQFVVQAHWVHNLRNDRSFSDYTGAFNPISNLAAGDHLRIYNLYYRHAWRDDRVVLKAGQLAADDDFLLSDYAALFLNSAFGPMPSQVGTPLAGADEITPAFPIYPVAAPGILLQVRPLQAFYTQLGLYYGRPGPDDRDNHGFAWADQSPAELALFWESGYTYDIAGRPATTRFGLSYHTGEVQDFRRITAGPPIATRQADPNFYFIHDFELLADSEGKPLLGLFGRIGFAPRPDHSLIAAYADAGLNWFPFPSREHDIAGLAVSHTRFAEEFRKSTGPNGVPSSETTVELTYKTRITPWLSLQADLQFLFNPAVNPDSGSRETATILGLRGQIVF